MTCLYQHNTVLIYIDDTLKGFMTIETYSHLYKVDVEVVRKALNSKRFFENEDHKVIPGTYYKNP